MRRMLGAVEPTADLCDGDDTDYADCFLSQKQGALQESAKLSYCNISPRLTSLVLLWSRKGSKLHRPIGTWALCSTFYT